jgi:hypothetical protein
MEEESISLRPRKSDESEKAEKRTRHLEKKFKGRKPINFGRLALGIFLVFVGIYYFAQSSGFLPQSMEIDINWWQLWPLLIVFAGLSLLSSRSRIIALVSGLFTILVLLVLGYFFITRMDAMEKHSQPPKTSNFEINNTSPLAAKAQVAIEANAASLHVSGATGPLVQGKLVSSVASIHTNTSYRDGVQYASVATKNSLEKFPAKYVNQLDLLVNMQKPLELSLDTNASQAELDLVKLPLTELQVKADASRLKITFPQMNLDAKFDTRTSDVVLIFPRDAAVRIASSTELTRGEFDGFVEILQDETPQTVLETQNYQESDQQIDIKLTSTLSRYKTLWLE